VGSTWIVAGRFHARGGSALEWARVARSFHGSARRENRRLSLLQGAGRELTCHSLYGSVS
jgi:hypothetical protein